MSVDVLLELRAEIVTRDGVNLDTLTGYRLLCLPDPRECEADAVAQLPATITWRGRRFDSNVPISLADAAKAASEGNVLRASWTLPVDPVRKERRRLERDESGVITGSVSEVY